MVALTYAQARTILQSRIADSSNDTAVDQALDQAQREVARAHRWPELMVRAFFNTEAAYETGTVAVTENSTTVTLTDGTWPSTVASSKFRFALSKSDPWYEVASRDSDTQITLAEAYVQDTATGKSYIAYRSHYTLASDVDRVEEMWLHAPGRQLELRSAASDERVTEFLHYPSGPGVPTHFYNMERTSSNERQVLLGPATPDDVYRVEYVYRKQLTDGALGLDNSRWPVVLARASAILYEPEYYERHLRAQSEFKRLLREEWAREGESETQEVRVGQTRMDYPGGDSYLDRLPGYGRVEDPSI